MSYRRLLPNSIEIKSTTYEDVFSLQELQEIVFPTLADNQRLKAEHYLNHIKIFPEGQFVAYHDRQLVGMTTSIRLKSDFLSKTHTFEQIIEGGFCNTHDPEGDWLYGVDMGTHPDFRGKGIARALYVARHSTVKKLGLRGQYTVGMLNGYGSIKSQLSRQQYFEELKAGNIKDPTVSAQLRIGFEIGNLVEDYLSDPACDNCGVTLILPAEKTIDDSDLKVPRNPQ